MAVVQREGWGVGNTDRGRWREVPIPRGAAGCVEDSHIVLQPEPDTLAGGQCQGVAEAPEEHVRQESGNVQGNVHLQESRGLVRANALPCSSLSEQVGPTRTLNDGPMSDSLLPSGHPEIPGRRKAGRGRPAAGVGSLLDGDVCVW